MIQFKRILIPTDFSPAAWNAINMAISICHDRDGSITLLHIYAANAKFDTQAKYSNEGLKTDMDRIKQRMVSFSKELSKSKKLEIDSVILKGWVDEEILFFIQNNDYDLVIMGVNGNGMDNRPGSHITKMIEQTSTPLMVIPNNQERPAISP